MRAYNTANGWLQYIQDIGQWIIWRTGCNRVFLVPAFGKQVYLITGHYFQHHIGTDLGTSAIQLLDKIVGAGIFLMNPAVLLLASPVATLVSAFRTLIGILVTDIFLRSLFGYFPLNLMIVGALITASAQKVVGPTNTSKFYFCKP